MLEFLPHLVLIGLVTGAAVLFIERGLERRDLLTMGLASLFVSVWMISVVMIDQSVQQQELPTFWLGLSVNALLPALFFVYLSVLMLETYYDSQRRIARREWLPLALVIAGLAAAHLLNPELFYRNVFLEAPATDRLQLNPTYSLHFSLGAGYYLFLAAAGYVIYGTAVRFPRVVAAMQLPEAERRTRLLLSLGMLAAFWGAAFDVLPTLLSSAAPSFMRLVGPALGVAGAFYAMVLARALDPKAVFRNTIFYVIRILLVAVPAIVALDAYGDLLASLSPRWSGLVVLGAVVAVDFAALRLKPLLDWLALRKSYNSTEAVNRYMHDLLVLRDARDFNLMVSSFLRSTMGAGEVRVWMPPLDDPRALHSALDGERITIPGSTRAALAHRDAATTPEDLQLDPRLYGAKEELGELFERLTAEVIVPLVDENKLLGLLSVGFKESFDEYYDQDLQLLDKLRKSTTLSLSNTLQYELARTGKPVKVYSRPEFDEAVMRQWRTARRSNEAISLVLLRMDDPQSFERERGQGKAAEFLFAIGERLRPTLRGRDLPAFFDEHTLALLLPQTNLTGAEIAGRRIRGWLESTAIALDGDEVTSRFTLAVATRVDGMEDPAELSRQAEDALSESTAVAGR